ncbi:aldehyde dehydrogenase family protein [Natronoglycomyces albus]|uniref:Aldehyde dehydrogenase family protein n=1 Tax=Natronoglycomyces albus TaxID=2811108 RepID=A0A895XSI0_9ACTN|nr:aldehyde dehydrogenase family protein [Natronoglycomyces albus]QSB06463.1 aldehyde dehydrogenase family protein [Natronoglycomyces albus]
MIRTINNFIDANSATPAGARYQPVVNPATGAVEARAAVSSDADVDRACTAAYRAFEEWSRATPGQRSHALLQAAATMDIRRQELIEIECFQTGQPREFIAADDVDAAIDVFRFFAGAARILTGPTAGEYLPGHTSYVRREPVGVCAVMVPFNYPLLMAAWKCAAALASGNTVVLKPSHNTPAAAVALANLLREHLPSGTVNVVLGDRTAVSALVTHPAVRYVAATASTRSGVSIATAALADVKQLHLGLGGKSPAIVTPNADLEAAAEAIGSAAFANSGQDCTAASRVIVHREVHDTMVDLLRDHALALTPGPPHAPESTLGPVATEAQYERLRTALTDIDGQADIVYGRQPSSDQGWFLAPAVVSGFVGGCALPTTELFGPILTVEPYEDLAGLVSSLNRGPYGLAASIHTRDHDESMRVASSLDFGCVWINTHLPLAAEMPHGGFRHSGFGKDLSVLASEEFTRVKHVMHAWDKGAFLTR